MVNEPSSITMCRCIPYRYKISDQTSVGANEELEVLVITSKKGKRMLFPKVSLHQIEYFDIPFFFIQTSIYFDLQISLNN
jgi:hypothetical protein